jgi:hypothetical protein
MRSRSLFASGAMLSLALVAACGGAQSNGVASKSPNEILAASKAAASSARSVHLSGSLVAESGTPMSVNLELVAGRGASGEISEHAGSFRFIALDGTIYVAGDPAFLRHLGGIPATKLFRGRWLKAPLTTAEFASFSSLTDMGAVLSTLLSSHGALKAVGAGSVHRQKAVAVTNLANGQTVYVATTGKPYPLEVANGGAGGGQIVFAGWNVISTFPVPADAIDIGPLEHT